MNTARLIHSTRKVTGERYHQKKNSRADSPTSPSTVFFFSERFRMHYLVGKNRPQRTDCACTLSVYVNISICIVEGQLASNQPSMKSFARNHKMTAIIAFFCLLLASFTDSSTSSSSKTSLYYSIAELATALDMASPGDHLFLANGRYNFSASLLIKADGISLSAQTSGGVLFTGGKVNIKIKGDGNTFAGFQFINGQSYEKGNVIDVFGDHNTLTDLNFDGYSAKKYISIRAGSQYNTIERCNFQNKPKHSHQGNLVEVQADKVEPGYHVIRQCSFQKMKEGKGGDNGNEPIRIGEGEQAGYVSRTVIEFNVFNNTGLADSESISVKAEENIIRYNTFADQQNAVLSFRNGNYNVAYGNFFLSSGGIRIREASHIAVYNNYFENSGDGKHYYPVDLGDVRCDYPSYPAHYQLKLTLM